MDALRRGLLSPADDISLALQNAGKTFGFLADGRELVTIADGNGGRVATLPDHSDEGWPEVCVQLPVGAEFAYAASGPLSRLARWKVERNESDVLEELSSKTDGPRFESRPDGGAVLSLGSNATLKVKAATPTLTMLSFQQVRDTEAIRGGLRDRVRR